MDGQNESKPLEIPWGTVSFPPEQSNYVFCLTNKSWQLQGPGLNETKWIILKIAPTQQIIGMNWRCLLRFCSGHGSIQEPLVQQTRTATWPPER